MCHLHYKLAKKSPGVTDPPTKEKVLETMSKYDLDASGTLTEDEFSNFAAKWFEKHGAIFLRRLVVTSFITMVVLPESAAILHRELPAARRIPRVIFKVLFGVGKFAFASFCATRIKCLLTVLQNLYLAHCPSFQTRCYTFACQKLCEYVKFVLSASRAIRC